MLFVYSNSRSKDHLLSQNQPSTSAPCFLIVLQILASCTPKNCLHATCHTCRQNVCNWTLLHHLGYSQAQNVQRSLNKQSVYLPNTPNRPEAVTIPSDNRMTMMTPSPVLSSLPIHPLLVLHALSLFLHFHSFFSNCHTSWPFSSPTEP